MSLVKRRVERVLASSAIGNYTKRRLRGKRLILAYHGIVPHDAEGAGERSLFITQKNFAAQLDLLGSVADVAPLAEIDQPGDGRPRVAITFDDGYRGALSEGVRELAVRGLPATFFIAPGRLGRHVFWWDSLAHERQCLDSGVREHALKALAGRDEQIRAWALDARVLSSDRLPSYAQTATCAELIRAAAVPGITLASHTWSHANLALLRGAELVEEVERPLKWLRRLFGSRAIPWLAYPYGLHSPESLDAAANASYVGAVRMGGGWHRADDVSIYARPRLGIPQSLSLDGFRARLMGTLLS